jgi:RNA polymerase sigma-70 factor, ECF subfamily
VIEELLAAYGRQIHGVAYVVLRSAADAEEVVMDTLLTAWDKGGSLRAADALKPWLLRIATRHSLSRLRRSREVDELASDPRATDPMARASDRLSLATAVGSLPPRMRAAIALHYYADLEVDAVARALGRSRNTVKSELRLALNRLRQSLADEPLSSASREQRNAT